MSNVIPFPLSRRRAFVQKHAARMAVLSREAAECHLRRQLDIQTDTLAKRGILPAIIVHEIRALEAAIRLELTWKALAPGVA
jgi:hypothetical protein